MPTTRVYRSTDAAAPILERLDVEDEATSMMALFNACLVTGYGSQAAAGWSRPFKDATQAVFRQGGGSAEYLYMLDGTDVSPTVRFIGYETMSAIATGTNPYPATVYASINYQAASGGIAMPWILLADDRTFYFYHRDETTSNYTALAYGDGYSYQSSGLYRTFLSNEGFYGRSTLIADGGNDRNYFPRTHLGVYNSVNQALSIIGDTAKGDSGLLRGLVPYPHGPDQKIWLAPLELVNHNVPAIRMRLRGFWHWLHNTASVADGDVFPGTDDLAGRNFLIIRNVQSAGSVFTNVVVHETTNWDTNS